MDGSFSGGLPALKRFYLLLYLDSIEIFNIMKAVILYMDHRKDSWYAGRSFKGKELFLDEWHKIRYSIHTLCTALHPFGGARSTVQTEQAMPEEGVGPGRRTWQQMNERICGTVVCYTDAFFIAFFGTDYLDGVLIREKSMPCRLARTGGFFYGN